MLLSIDLCHLVQYRSADSTHSVHRRSSVFQEAYVDRVVAAPPAVLSAISSNVLTRVSRDVVDESAVSGKSLFFFAVKSSHIEITKLRAVKCPKSRFDLYA